MNKLFVILLLVPVLVFGKKKKHENQHMLPGRWVEVKRMTLDSTIVPFTDTLFMTFQMRDTFTYRLRDGFVYRGKYTYDEDDHLDFGTVSYTVALRRQKSLILTNPAGIYFYAVDTSDTAAVIVLAKEDKILPVTDIDVMIGHWNVYKRTIDKEGGGVDYSNEIKTVYITGPSSDDKMGYLYCGADGIDNASWYIKGLTSDQTLDCDGKKPRNIKVVKCQKGEMILSENGVNYFLKQFK